MKYKINKGCDHYNQKPLFRVVGIDNEYVGEWDKNMLNIRAEINYLESKIPKTKIDKYIDENIINIISLAGATTLNHAKACLVKSLSRSKNLNILTIKREVYIHKVLERKILRFASEIPCYRHNEGYELSKLCNTLTIESRRLLIECKNTFFLNKYSKSLSTQTHLSAFLYSLGCTFKQTHLKVNL